MTPHDLKMTPNDLKELLERVGNAILHANARLLGGPILPVEVSFKGPDGRSWSICVDPDEGPYVCMKLEENSKAICHLLNSGWEWKLCAYPKLYLLMEFHDDLIKEWIDSHQDLLREIKKKP